MYPGFSDRNYIYFVGQGSSDGNYFKYITFPRVGEGEGMFS
jgi:hypothetical protein